MDTLTKANGDGFCARFECECGRELDIRVEVSRATATIPQLPNRGTALPVFEREVLCRVAEGLTDRETARLLQVSVNRVHHAVRSATAHLAARTRSEAVYRAVCAGQLG